MEIPSEVLIYHDQIAGEPKRGRLLATSAHGYYEINMQTASGVRRVLLPISRTLLISAEIEPAASIEGPEVER